MSTTTGLSINSLIGDGEISDGLFFIDFETIEKCPASYGALFALLTITLQQKVAVVDLKSLTVNSMTMSAGSGTVTLSAKVKISGDFTSISVNIVPFAQYSYNGTDTWSPNLDTITFTSPGEGTKSFTYDFDPATTNPPPPAAYPLSIDLKVAVTAGENVVVLPHTTPPNEKKVTISVTQ
jgi:hypothetical protein